MARIITITVIVFVAFAFIYGDIEPGTWGPLYRMTFVFTAAVSNVVAWGVSHELE